MVKILSFSRGVVLLELGVVSSRKRLIPVCIIWYRKWEASDGGVSLRWSEENDKIYGECPVRWGGGQPITWGNNQQNMATLGGGGGFHQACPTMGNPDRVDRALNQSPKKFKNETFLNISQEFPVLQVICKCSKRGNYSDYESTTALNGSRTCPV